MEHASQDLSGHARNCCASEPDRFEIADALHQTGTSEGFSMEWFFDRKGQEDRDENGKPEV